MKRRVVWVSRLAAALAHLQPQYCPRHHCWSHWAYTQRSTGQPCSLDRLPRSIRATHRNIPPLRSISPQILQNCSLFSPSLLDVERANFDLNFGQRKRFECDLSLRPLRPLQPRGVQGCPPTTPEIHSTTQARDNCNLWHAFAARRPGRRSPDNKYSVFGRQAGLFSVLLISTHHGEARVNFGGF